jgi:hypothetical protein
MGSVVVGFAETEAHRMNWLAASLLLCSLFASAANYSVAYSDGIPTVSSCGTAPSVTGTDSIGVITTGSGTVTTCTLNFSTTLQAAPSCAVTTDSTSVTAAISSASSAAMTVGLSSTLTSGKIYFHCLYLPGAYDPQILWAARMETGDLTEWGTPDNTGSAISTAVTGASAGITAHGGSWVMKQQVTSGSAGTRMNPYPPNGVNTLSQAGTTFYASWWEYHTFQITFANTEQYMLWQIASYDGASYAPIWALYVNGTDFTPILIWSPNNAAPSNGPHNGETGKRTYTSSTPVPIGAWVFFECLVTPSAGFTGELKIWMNRALLWDQLLVKTRFPDGPGTPNAGYMYTTHNAYGSNLTPTPAYHFVDDVTYSLGRMP